MNTNPHKLWRLFFAVIMVLTTSAGCGRELKMSSSYSFACSMEHVDRIELLENKSVDAFSLEEDAFLLIRILDDDEIESFMTGIYEIETSYCISPPLRGYGRYIAKITYDNGDVEMLGTRHIEHIKSGADPTGVGAYYFIGDSIEQLILSFGKLKSNR